MTRALPILGTLGALMLALAGVAHAADCTADDFAKAVDDAGAKLRAFNQANSPKVRAKMQLLRDKRGWSSADYESKAIEQVHDPRLAELDARANELLTAIDTLGQPPADAPLDCRKLDELKNATANLLEVMAAKSEHMLARLDAAAGIAPAQKSVVAASPTTPTPPPDAAGRAAAPPPPTRKAGDAAAKPDGAGRPSRTEAPASAAPPSGTTQGREETAAAIGVPPPPPDARQDSGADGYTIDEIRDATRGFFGTISTNLAAVIEHAFASYGRPSGYVLGKEGGGAFLAGLRYGSGMLYMRSGGERQVYWHGPSLGYDFGAEGSRTMFLIYHLSEPEALFRRFTGIDGSAYLVGGVGITFLKGGDVIMAPIRSGLGLRLGANLGYVRFTPKPTWNPF